MARRGRSRSLANPVFHKPARLGCDAVRRLHDEVVQPIATPATKGAWYKQWRLVSLDGSTLDVVDEPALDAAFGRPGAGHGESAYPQIRFVSLAENGPHVLFATQMAGCTTSEIALTKLVLPSLRAGMLCLADRSEERRVGQQRRSQLS